MTITIPSYQHEAPGRRLALLYIVENWSECKDQISIEFATFENKKAIKVTGDFLFTKNGERIPSSEFYVQRQELKLSDISFLIDLKDIILSTDKEYQELVEKQKLFNNLMTDVYAKKVAYTSDNTSLNETILQWAVYTATKDVDTAVRQFEKSVRRFLGFSV